MARFSNRFMRQPPSTAQATDITGRCGSWEPEDRLARTDVGGVGFVGEIWSSSSSTRERQGATMTVWRIVKAGADAGLFVVGTFGDRRRPVPGRERPRGPPRSARSGSTWPRPLNSAMTLWPSCSASSTIVGRPSWMLRLANLWRRSYGCAPRAHAGASFWNERLRQLRE